MNILILDDMIERHEEFARRYSGNKVVHVFRYNQCIDELVLGGWDVVHLDHDLGDEISDADTTVDGWGKQRLLTGFDVAKWIAGCEDYMLPKKIIVHSVNPIGGMRMYQELSRRGMNVSFEPFCKLN
jgi:hypothetical protein